MYRKAQFFLVRKIFAFLEQYEGMYGFHGVVKKILQWTKATMRLHGMDLVLEKQLSHGPVVVIANHPTSASVLALIATLPERKDLYLFVGSKFFGHSKAIDKHLIPAYINNRCQPKDRPYPDTVPKEEEHRRNIESIKKAADIVNGGGLVLIFPGYPEEKGSAWYNGVGHLIRQITQGNACVELVHITEYAPLGYLRLIPLLGIFFPPICFQFFPPIQRREITEMEPKQITRNLENRFVSGIMKVC